MTPTLTAKITAETIGTAMLLATVVGSGIMGETLSPSSDAIALLANSIATGAILVVLILMFGPVSGAHFNPAVTLAFLLNKKIQVPTACLYVIAQLVGAVAGVVAAHGMFDQELLQISEKIRTSEPQWLAEGIATFGLVSTILMVAIYRQEAVAYAVGLYITAAYWFTASTSFANPAVTFAREFTNTFSGIAPASAPGFIVAQIAAAVIATYFCLWLTRQNGSDENS